MAGISDKKSWRFFLNRVLCFPPTSSCTILPSYQPEGFALTYRKSQEETSFMKKAPSKEKSEAVTNG